LNFESISKSFMLATFVTIAILTILSPSFLVNESQAQTPQSNSLFPSPSTSTSTSSSPSKTHAVKITTPTKGQQVPIGKDLTITGSSIANASSNCQVSIIVNHVKPYQSAYATGPAGNKDYTKWNFVLTSKYAALSLGSNNKITAKYSCTSSPSVVSYYSVNVTGVPAAVTSAATIQQPPQSVTPENNSSNTAAASSAFGPNPVIPGIP
jgi:hypothetical protein